MSRFGPRRRDAIYELRITVAAIDKLAARGISVRDTEQLINNRYVIRRNTGVVTATAASSLPAAS